MALINPKYSNLPKKSNIQGFWRLEETSGTRYDLSTNKNNLTDNNTVGYAIGKIGNAADFEASNLEYLSITDAAQTGLDITGEITISCWIKPESINSTYIIISKYKAGGMSYSLAQRYYGEIQNQIMFQLSSDGSTYTAAYSSSKVSAGNWYHIAATLNQTTDKMQVYFNGAADGSAISYTSNIYNSNTQFNIGVSGNMQYYYDGLIDEAIIWNTCLTADEIADVYAITSEDMYGKKLGILAWWFCRDSWKKHDKLWKPKILKPEFEI